MLLRPVGMWAEEYKAAGDRIHEILSKAPGPRSEPQCAGRLVKGPPKGHVDGDQVEFASGSCFEGNSLSYTCKSTFCGDTMSAAVDLGEYGPATFPATGKA